MIDKYLEKIQSPEESIFPMDTPHRKHRVLRKVIYGEKTDLAGERQRIMIDFDGVIHKYNGWNDGKLNDEAIDGAKEAIDQLRQNFEIVIFTTRASTSDNGSERTDMLLDELKQWLEDRSIYYDMITSEKLGAIAYIDDRAIRFNGNWEETLNFIKSIESDS